MSRVIAPRHPITGSPTRYTKWFSWLDATDCRKLTAQVENMKATVKDGHLLELYFLKQYLPEHHKDHWHGFLVMPLKSPGSDLN